MSTNNSISTALGGSYVLPLASLRKRFVIFIMLFVTQLISNVDSGACAVLLAFPKGQMTTAFSLTAFQVGTLLSAMYAGHTAGCLAAAYLLLHYPSKPLLCASLIVYSLCILAFALSDGFAMSLSFRLIGGFVSAFIVVYGPIWVDDFAPPMRKSLWMSLVQAGVALGITFGYLAVGFIEANANVSWRIFFYVQSGLLLVLGIFFAVMDAKVLNRPLHVVETEQTSRKNVSVVRRVMRRLKRLLGNPIYVGLVLELCALYFVVNGLQMWATSYLEGPPVDATRNAIVAVFGACSATAPVVGVIFGGWLVDRVGGYGNIQRTCLLCLVMGSLACVCAFLSLVMSHLAAFAACIWILLFFGGAVLPASVGMAISTVEKRLKPLASGVSSCAYNLLGFFLGPFVAGAVADHFGVEWGFRVIMGTSSVAVVSLFLVTMYVRQTSLDISVITPLTGDVDENTETDVETDVSSSQTMKSPSVSPGLNTSSYGSDAPGHFLVDDQ